MKNKLVSITVIGLSIIIIAFGGIGKVAASFSDVPSNYIYIDAINYAEDNNIVNGYSDGTFRPYVNITRGQLAKIIIGYKYSSSEIQNCSNVDFPDVDTNNTFKRFICIAKKYSVVNGYSDGRFKPDDNVTTAEAIKIISNALGYTSGNDSDRTNLFKYYIDALAGRKALPETLVDRDTKINRGEVVEIIYRLANNITNKTSKDWNQLTGNNPTTSCASEFEVENANNIVGFSVTNDSSASNSKALTANGAKNTSAPDTSKATEICLNSSGVAFIEILAKAQSGSADSLWLIKGSSYENIDIDETNQYKWYRSAQISISGGDNTIKLATREPGVVIDKVRIVGGGTTPTITPTPTPTLTSTPTGTPTLTPTPNPNAGYPSDLLRNYKQWKITFPDGTTKFDLKDISNEYFYVNTQKNGIVFKAPIRSNNGTTPNSSYIRSELREMLPDGSNEIYWTTSGKHVLYVKQAITHLPTVKKHLVASQIHGNKSDGIDDAMVLRLEDQKLFLSFNGGKLRSDVTVKTNYSLGTLHEVIFEVENGKHMAYYSEDGNLLNAYNAGNADAYAVKENGNKVLMTKNYGEAYFKAGNYTQSNKDKEGSETDKPGNYGEVVVYDLWVSHQ
jgi:hypothetical protein